MLAMAPSWHGTLILEVAGLFGLWSGLHYALSEAVAATRIKVTARHGWGGDGHASGARQRT